MTISIWRFSHFALALVSSLFLIIASVTGVILAIEPLSHQAKGYAVRDNSKVSLATTLDALKQNYDEVLSLEVEAAGFVKASVLTSELAMADVYIDPVTGKTLGKVQERPKVYSFATNLHRSLFLKSIGRAFVAVVSFLLLLITITGFLLLIKRQGGWRFLFSRVHKDHATMRYHVILSRWLFIPIVIIATTGVYLSAEKFDLFTENKVLYKEAPTATDVKSYDHVKDIPLFQKTTLDQVRSVTFPFSTDPADYYIIALKDREIQVNQQTGEVVSSAHYPFTQLASRASYLLHTGESSSLWSVILLLTSASILFFMYTGFAMSLKRIKKVTTITTMPHKDHCDTIILVGSETGSTFDFARQLYNSLSATGKQVYLTTLNRYSAFAKAEQIIILTATYGAGEAPTNAQQFEKRLSTIDQPKKLRYAVVGFGSTDYPDYCKFAIKVDTLLQHHADFTAVLPLFKVNNASAAQFQNWCTQYAKSLDIALEIAPKATKGIDLQQFKVTERTALNADDTFLLRLQPVQKTTVISGDLLAVSMANNERARLYSVAVLGNDLLLSIKKHDLGKCSTYLAGLEAGNTLQAAVIANTHFYLPDDKKPAVLIANGTGIAPFLGMLSSRPKKEIHLFWGVRTLASATLYEAALSTHRSTNKNSTRHTCYSKEVAKTYVQERIAQEQEVLLHTIKKGGVIMICGSLKMQQGVLNVLENILHLHTNLTIDLLREREQLKMDCY